MYLESLASVSSLGSALKCLQSIKGNVVGLGNSTNFYFFPNNPSYGIAYRKNVNNMPGPSQGLDTGGIVSRPYHNLGGNRYAATTWDNGVTNWDLGTTHGATRG